MQDFLNQQANQIESVLQAHGFGVRVVGGDLSPRLIHYRLSLPGGTRLARLAPLLGELAGVLQAGAVRLSTDPESGVPSLEVPRPDPLPVRLLPLAKKVANDVPELSATLGLDISGAPLLLRLAASGVGSVLVSGENAAGKSSLLQVMTLSLALHNAPDTLRILALDVSAPARRGRRRLAAWHGMEELPHFISEPVRDLPEAILRVRWLGRLMAERREELEQRGEIAGPALAFIVDGLETLLEGQGAAERKGILAEVAERGRELHLFLVGATKHPQAVTGIGWGARLVGRTVDAEQAKAASGIIGSGAEGLLGEGDFLAVLGGDAVRFQAAWATEEEVARTTGLLQQVAERERRARDLEQASPEAHLKTARPTHNRPAPSQPRPASGR